MVFWRRSSSKGERENVTPKIEEVVGDDDASPKCTTQPIVEEPDEEGNYPAPADSSRFRHSSSRRMPDSRSDIPSPYDHFFSEQERNFNAMDPFGADFMSSQIQSMHQQLQSQFFGPSMFGPDPFMRDSMGMGMLMGPSPFQQQRAHSSPIENSGTHQPIGDQFAYEFQTFSSTGNVSGQRRERHFSARGSTGDNTHHISESVRGGDGRIQSRQESIPFGQRSNARGRQQAIANE